MKVGLFIPCYINAIYPNVGVASYRLLKSLGVDVDYPLDQTCCGQPMANAGFEGESAKLALRFDDLFREYDYIVGPSAICERESSRYFEERRARLPKCGKDL